MDFRKLARGLPQPIMDNLNGTNSTLPPLTDLPPNILEALIPGYSLISRYATLYLGLDISLFVTAGLIILALNKGGQYLYTQLERLLRATVMSSVYIDEHDDLFDMVMAWLAAHQTSTSRSRSMRAKTQRGSKADDAYDEVADDALDSNGMFNFTKWSARTPPRYEPYYGSQFVWHGGRVFFFRRSRQPSQGQRVQVSFGQTADDDIIQLDCLGRSIEPIKELIKTIRVWSLDRTRYTTTIRHPMAKERARFGGAWNKTSSRPSRPMDTVILDNDQKDMVVKDMNEYLHPSSVKWYAQRGIPYRRGYLFHGPPGTGKTSLSFALAGIFGLEIYAISLQEPTLTENDLMQLFNSLPRRCIVLLEDVDAAGLIRDGNSDSNSGKKKKGVKDGDDQKQDGDKGKKDGKEKPKKDEEYTLKDLAKELKSIGGGGGGGGGRGGRGGRGDISDSNNPNRQPGTGISLSGLLNAIDGVATHEGRVLIMTTNHPEKLDSALIRPGRVDRKVEFQLAMREQVRELFVRMYAASDETIKPKLSMNGHATGEKQTNGQKQTNGHAIPPKSTDDDELLNMTRNDIEDLAKRFAADVPDDTFTPAEIQNLLMRHKKSPNTAFAVVKDWIKETLEEKEKERKQQEENEAEDDD